eukprot:4545216-Pyramimonas_sp.AAC.1
MEVMPLATSTPGRLPGNELCPPFPIEGAATLSPRGRVRRQLLGGCRGNEQMRLKRIWGLFGWTRYAWD